MAKPEHVRAQLMQTGDLEVVYRDPATLKGYPNNARTHSPEQVAMLRRSIDAYGFTNPVLLRDDGVSIGAGHGRQMAALLTPALERVPTIIVPGLTEEQWRAYILADNQMAISGSGWDETLLRNELVALKGTGFDMALTGFGALELTSLFGSAQEDRDPEEAPEPPTDPVSRVGDIWHCGEHRVGCLNSLDIADVRRLLGGVIPDLANCDPPYGIKIVKGASDGGAKGFGRIGGHQHSAKNELGARGRVHGPAKRAIIKPGVYAPIIGDDTVDTALAAYGVLLALKVPAIVLWGGNYYADKLPASRCWLVWDKENSGSFADAELAWTNQDKVVKLLRHQWSGLIKASERGQKRVHPTQKPVALAEWAQQTIAPEAKTVLDLFLGSGSVLIAAERGGVICYGSELSPNYVDCAVRRWMDFTGLEAFHESGEPWSDVAQQRMAEAEAVA